MSIAGVLAVAILLILAIHNRRRRARMTPEQRMAEDQLRATQDIARSLRHNRRL